MEGISRVPQTPDKNEALTKIEAERDRIMRMGRNSDEQDEINRIAKMLETDELTPVEALTRVKNLEANKQDYN